ncbi:MAG TPA: hypothetical protein VFF52_01515 [Isosphaeraceae bacterium]|nr:hypothetical protein [Isosphaeraceae bacterium]
MKIEELKKAKDQRPFRPFSIRMADGKEIPVRHPDAVAWDDDVDDEDNGEAEEPLTVVCVVPGGGWEVIDLDLVTSLGFPPAQSKGKGKKGKSKGD